MPQTKEVTYKYDLGTEELTAYSQKNKVYSPYDSGTPTHTAGLHQGKYHMNWSFLPALIHNKTSGNLCIYYKDIKVEFMLDPTIFVSKDHLSHSCEHKAIEEHEMKHLMTDRQLVNEFSALMGKAIFDDLDNHGYVWGPIYPDQIEGTVQEMEVSLRAVIEPFLPKLQKERKRRQQLVDTVEEYERVSQMCATSKGRGRKHRR